MEILKRKEALILLGQRIIETSKSTDFKNILSQTHNDNPWFTADFVKYTLLSIANNYLSENKLNVWLEKYDIKEQNSGKTVGLTLAGNIPLVGFHDILCTFVSGHKALIKMSSKDKVLLPYLLEMLFEIAPESKNYFELTHQHFKNFDAVIATGSDNTARYFEYYFGQHPHIIRKNRNSIAVLHGQENKEELTALADDIFLYFGLGCRNVSKLFVPENYDFNDFFEAMNKYDYLINHHKYANNYIYNKSIMMVNQEEFKDNGFMLLKEERQTASPISLLYYQSYTSKDMVKQMIEAQKDHIQVVVSNGTHDFKTLAFGQAQNPELWDYADNVDVMDFLLNLANK